MPRLRVTRRSLVLSACIVSLLLWYCFSDSSGAHARHAHGQHGGYAQNANAQVPLGAKAGSAARPAANRAAVSQIMADGLEYASNGMLAGWDKVHRKLAKAGLLADERHPILELMDRGQRRWDSLLKRQSKTLPQAATEYRKRYGRAPPKGFDRWYKYCRDNNVKIIDDYDQIDRDIRPWLALSPAQFKQRLDALEQLPFSFKLVLRPKGKSEITGERALVHRPQWTKNIVEPLAPMLHGDVTLYGSDHDMGSDVLTEELWDALLDNAARGTFVPDDELKRMEDQNDKGLGLLACCSESSPARNKENRHTEPTGPKFVYDPAIITNYCQYPELMEQHGSVSNNIRRSASMRPYFSLSKLAQGPSFRVTPLEAYKNASSEDAQKTYSPWERKSIDKIFWRGTMTGDFYSGKRAKNRPNYDWRVNSHRTRLHMLAQKDDGFHDVWVQRDGKWREETWTSKELSERYLDIGLIGGARQCDKGDGTCAEMDAEIQFAKRVEPEHALDYKYVFDVDGNGWSSRFHRLLASGSMVLKTTIYPEWNSDWLTPWVHYVPCRLDYTDLYDIMSFFTGPPDDSGGGHDALAAQIAAAGRKFTREFWRWEDMQAYMFRLLLEYQRVAAADRAEFDY